MALSQVSLFIFVYILIGQQVNAKQQIITEGPVSQQAKIGDSVILKCKINNLAGEPQWCIDDFCLGFSKKVSDLLNGEQLTLKGRPRHKIVGDHSKGEYHLRIEPVQLQDNMYFYCMATAAVVNIKAVKSERVFLTVLTYPQSLNLANPMSVSLNKPSTVQCIARQSRPPVKILIAVNGKLITDESQYSIEIIQKPVSSPQSEYAINSVRLDSFDKIHMEDMRSSFYDTITNLTLKDVTMDMQDQVIECFVYSFMKSKKIYGKNQAVEPTLSSFRNNVMKTKSKIQVNFAPEVNLKVISSNKVLKEEDVISLMCHTRATPKIQTYKWYVGNNYLSGVEGASLNLKLRKEMHKKSVTCEATNSVASVKASIQLNILYKPSFLKGSKSFMLIDKKSCNAPLTLDCQVNANPTANITWYRRRLSKNLIQSVRKDSHINQVDISKLIKMNINDYYYDELIGNGPTYTIASFNCANKLNNQSKTAGNYLHTRNKRSNEQRNNIFNDLGNDDKNEYDDIYEDYVDPFEYEDEDYNSFDSSNDINIDFLHSHRGIKDEFDDFGIYICEASNILSLSNHYESKRHVKRYIKINPIGAPILRIISFPLTSSNMEKMISTIMIPSDTDEHNLKVSEYASSIGDSISLTCLIEPLPEIQTVVWIKDNGKIIPNSKYSIFETVTASTKKSSRNYRIKYENLTTNSDEIKNQEESVYLSDSLIGRKSLKSNDAGLMRSVLYIKNVREQDFGIYKCKSTNAYGSRTGSVLVREKNIFDNINMNNQMVFTATVGVVIIAFACLVLIFMCIISKRIRDACCFYRVSKQKELLSQNSNCEQNSDKTINEWLASSKLSNDTSTNTAATLDNNKHHNRLLINTPQQLRREIAAGNCSSLLNDDMDDIEHNSSNETLEQSRRRNLGLLSEPNEFNIPNSTFNKTGNNNSNTNNYYQTSHFNRFLVSSPLMSSSSSQKENSIEDMGTQALTKTMHMPPHMMTIRSQNISNGDFNAKISSGFSNCAINEIKNPSNYQIQHNKPQFNTFTMKPKTDNSIYENSKASSTELNKMLQDTTFRLSDLFNELSPNLMSNNTNTLPHNTPRNNYQGTLPKNHTNNNMSLFQQFPTMVSVSSPKHLPNQSNAAGSRQNLLQTTLPQQTNTSFNKFPNPQTAKSTTSKFYTNFYRNPNLQNNQENYNYDDNNSTTTTCTNSLQSNAMDTKQNSPNYSNNSPIAKIVTTSSQNGSNKYQTVV